MTRGATLDEQTSRSVLEWAAGRQTSVTATLLTEEGWSNLRSQFVRFDPEQGLLQITFPITCDHSPPPEIGAGAELGISFRRGHKKCILVGRVVMRRADTGADGAALDTLLVRVSKELRELQRRVYQRVIVPPDRFIAVKLWEGGVPAPSQACWPLCAGRLRNASVGGILVEIRADQNPRLSVGDGVGVEITVTQGRHPLVAGAQYRHCRMEGPGRLGLGLQFIGLEHEIPSRASIMRVAEFVKSLQRENARRCRSWRMPS